MKRRLRAPSPALVISLIALFVALGGTTYAATSLPKNSVGSTQLKKNAVTGPKIKNGAVTAAKINTKGLTVPTAMNATDLGGHAAAFYAAITLQSGQTESGDWGVAATGSGDAIEGISFPTRLAAPLDSSHVAYLGTGTSANCPGVGQAAAGYLCVYGMSAGLSTIGGGIYTHSAVSGADPYGFDVEFQSIGPGGGAGGAWSVTAP